MTDPAETSAIALRPLLRGVLHYGLLVGVGAVTAVVVGAGPQEPLLALMPVAVVAGLWLVTRAPLVATVSVLLTALLAIDDHGDTFGQWRSPLAIVGDTLHFRIDAVLGVPGLAVTGMEIAALGLLVVWLQRRMTPRRDQAEPVPAASVLEQFLLIYLAAVAISEMVGLARGLSAVPWKLRNLLHPVLLTLLFLVAYRRPRDDRLIGRIVVFAACARAVQAVIVQREAISLTGGPFVHATSHGDSVLFAVAAYILIVDLLEQPSRRRLVRAALLIPIIVMGAVENDRRLVWVMFGMMIAAAYVVSPMKRWKRSLTRLFLAGIPLLILYAAVGWNSSSRVFAPVRTFRGVSDSSVDRSAYWRDVETWNIATSMKESPILGLGLGGEYTEYMANDDISQAYKEYREWPHNTVLGLLLLMGLIPFTATWALIPLVIFFAVRSYRMAATANDRVAALGCLGAAMACLVLAWGDTGAHFPQYKIFVALAVALSARLAVATGAWPTRRRFAEE
jgi:hypothetical protein